MLIAVAFVFCLYIYVARLLIGGNDYKVLNCREDVVSKAIKDAWNEDYDNL